MFSFNFEKLDVWREAIQFANLIYQLTNKFPERERFGLTNQMRRAAVSVSSNLAEGSSRMSRVILVASWKLLPAHCSRWFLKQEFHWISIF